MPKDETHYRSRKPSPYPQRDTSNRRQSVRYAENFDDVLESCQRIINMTGEESNLASNNAQGQPQNLNPESVKGLGDSLQNNPDEAENLAKLLTELRLKRDKPKRRLLAFSNVTGVSRRMLNEIGVIVNLYRDLKDIEKSISQTYSEWLLVCGKTEEQLENESHLLRPSLIDQEIDDIGNLIDKVEATFKSVKQQYPDKQEIIDYLDFVDSVPKQRDSAHLSPTRSGSSESAALGKGKQYLQKKIPILKKEVENRYENIKQQFDSNIYSTEGSLHDALKKLEALESKISEDSTFKNYFEKSLNLVQRSLSSMKIGDKVS